MWREDDRTLTWRHLRVGLSRRGLLLWVVALLAGVTGFFFKSAALMWAAYALVVLLLAALVRAVSTLLHLRLRATAPAPCFAGDAGLLELRVENPGARDRWDIGVGGSDLAGPSTWVDVPPRSHNLALLACPTFTRGWSRWPTLRVQTQHPMHLYRVSTLWQPRLQLLVYPRPLIEGVSSQRRQRLADAAAVGPLWLSFDGLPVGVGQDPERLLSLLVGRILQAERNDRAYGLRVGALVVPPGQGLRHRNRCLEILSLWKPEGVHRFSAGPQSPDVA